MINTDRLVPRSRGPGGLPHMHLNFYQLVAQKAKYKKNSTFSMYLYVEEVEFFFYIWLIERLIAQ